jgi:hypothetical protein
MTQPLRSPRIAGVPRHYELLRPWCAASVRWLSWRYPLERLPSHQHDRFPRSLKEPRTASRHLHTGHHPASRQAPAGFFPDHNARPLERENRELKRTNEILRKASAFFAQAEFDHRPR